MDLSPEPGAPQRARISAAIERIDLSRVLGGIGRALISAGVLILLFVAYQLWGTGIQTRAAQNQLDTEFEAKVANWRENAPPTTEAAAVTTPDGAPLASAPAPDPVAAAFAPAPPPAEHGTPIAQITADDIGLDWKVVEGVGTEDLQKGPGHYPGTPLPGQPGNAAIAGHRTTWAAPFNRIDELDPGDIVSVTTVQGSFEYRVSDTFIVLPSEYSRVIREPEGNLLTLTSCHPKRSAAKRIIVQAELVGPTAPASPATPGSLSSTSDTLPSENTVGFDPSLSQPATTTPSTGDSDSPNTTAVGAAAIDSPTTTSGAAGGAPELAIGEDGPGELDEGIGRWRELSAWGAVLPWALLCAAAWLGSRYLARHWRAIPAYAVGLPIFLLFLFMFFENFTIILPAAY